RRDGRNESGGGSAKPPPLAADGTGETRAGFQRQNEYDKREPEAVAIEQPIGQRRQADHEREPTHQLAIQGFFRKGLDNCHLRRPSVRRTGRRYRSEAVGSGRGSNLSSTRPLFCKVSEPKISGTLRVPQPGAPIGLSTLAFQYKVYGNTKWNASAFPPPRRRQSSAHITHCGELDIFCRPGAAGSSAPVAPRPRQYIGSRPGA